MLQPLPPIFRACAPFDDDEWHPLGSVRPTFALVLLPLDDRGNGGGVDKRHARVWVDGYGVGIDVLASSGAEYISIADARDIDPSRPRNSLYLCFDLCTGGELFDRISKGNYYEADSAGLVRTIFKSVKYVHEVGIVHRGACPPCQLWRRRRLMSDERRAESREQRSRGRTSDEQ
ncbi:hypothetical protein DFP72DRAFT_1070434 [Ephemerocybe angulata]|uniref:Protein kinase domain-containing protein n=1 Tax=Ephemerocybe angulata TaxID=980116 RepID=A0A8H6HSQ6_9AGAR|nr:hypothetical protein DFP72DRAFT_1070434 [Tulosesus angulatus]